MTSNRTKGEDLEFANRALARLLHMEPAGLSIGAEPTLDDELLVCGILGGKDVGKSTLINALAGAVVSRDDAEVGRGTDRPIAYAHEASRRALDHRLRAGAAGVQPIQATHRVDAIRDVVLIDLPDFDSEFREHLDTVRSVIPTLDRVLWVVTPRKLGDRAWVELSRDVLKDAGNVLCVLNKIDELLADSDPFEDAASGAAAIGRAERFVRTNRQWLMSITQAAGLTLAAERFFLLAAAFPTEDDFARRVATMWGDNEWRRFEADRQPVRDVAAFASREITRLRDTVLSPVAAERAAAAKRANIGVEIAAGTARLREHFGVDRLQRQLHGACEPAYLRDAAAEALGPDGLDDVETDLRRVLRPDKELADELLEQRLDRHPLLRIVYWPFGWAARMIGSQISGVFGPGSMIIPSSYGSNLIESRLDALRSRVLADHAAVVKRLDLEGRVPDAASLATGLRRGTLAFARRLEEEQLRQSSRGGRFRAACVNLFLWWTLLWFPLLQPVSLAALSVLSGDGMDYAKAAIVVVTSLGAGHLLASLGVVAAIHVAVLALLHSSGRRRLRALRGPEAMSAALRDGVEEVLEHDVLEPLARPFAEAAAELDRLVEKHLAA